MANDQLSQFIIFVYSFYVLLFPLYFSHHSLFEDLIVIHFCIDIYWGDPLGRFLFTLICFQALCKLANLFPSYVFPSMANNTFITGHAFVIHDAFDHFAP